jgi:lipid-A-disaccharide synthase
MLVAGEASGDALGAELIRALRTRLGERLRVVGVGGARMAAEGVQSPFDIAQLSILGLFEGLMAYRKVVRLADITADLARRERPDVAVLIDSWGYTLRVAQRLRKADPGLLLIKYVGPQVWASRPGRAKTLAGAVDHLLSIHAFDAPHFETEGLGVTFVGNPALSRSFEGSDPQRLRASIGARPEDLVLLVAPGSRPAEIDRVFPPFAEAVALLKRSRPDLHVVVPVAATVAERVKAHMAGWPFQAHVLEEEGDKTDAMVAADVALACSGTVTTELALAGAPLVVGYRIGSLTYAVLKRIIRTPYVTLLNIAAGRFVAPELIQHACTGPGLAEEVERRLADPDLRRRQREEQFAALDKMGRGGPNPSDRAAEGVLELLRSRGRL